MVQLLFWSCFALLGWTFAGYPAFSLMGDRVKRETDAAPGRGDRESRAIAVLAVRNGLIQLERSVANLLSQEYPLELLDPVVVPNGCASEASAVAARLTGAP